MGAGNSLGDSMLPNKPNEINRFFDVDLEMGAHHLDLMFEDPADPPCTKAARAAEEMHIRKLIAEKYAAGGSR